jgi:membrane protease YdiL (CAAX protease family)
VTADLGVQPGGGVRSRRTTTEILLVLGVSLGASAAYSIVSIIDRSTRTVSLAHQSTTINNSLSSRPTFDLIYQLMGLFFDLVPVALVGFLLWQVARPHLSRLGIDFTRPLRDTGWGLGLAVIIGVPGIGVYLAGRALGITVAVVPDALGTYWWTVPVLALSALRAGLQEEVIVIGYLFARLRDLGWSRWWIIIASAALRGSYHLYQGFGAFVGNFAMGILFGWLYTKYGRLLPLVIAHFAIDAAIFVGYPWAAAAFPALFGVPAAH